MQVMSLAASSSFLADQNIKIQNNHKPELLLIPEACLYSKLKYFAWQLQVFLSYQWVILTVMIIIISVSLTQSCLDGSFSLLWRICPACREVSESIHTNVHCQTSWVFVCFSVCLSVIIIFLAWSVRLIVQLSFTGNSTFILNRLKANFTSFVVWKPEWSL